MWSFEIEEDDLHFDLLQLLQLNSKKTWNLKCVVQGWGDFWAQPAKIHPFTTSTGVSRILPFANLLPFIWTGQYPLYIFFQLPANFFFIVMTTGQELGHW
jgi:hypothetical protein